MTAKVVQITITFFGCNGGVAGRIECTVLQLQATGTADEVEVVVSGDPGASGGQK